MQESAFYAFRGDKVCGLEEDGTRHCVYRSFGPMQIHYEAWRERLKIDPLWLLTDIDYNYHLGTTILLYFKNKHESTDLAWVGRYNSNTEVFKLKYWYRIQKQLVKINANLDKMLATASEG